MRTFTICILAMGMLFQVGCASIPSMSKLTLHRKPKPDPKTSTAYLKAKELERQGKFERARELYTEMLEKDPQNPEFMHRLAVICTRLQRYGEADDYFDRACKRTPKDVSLVADRGYSYFLRGDLDEAERLLRKAVHLKPSDKRAVSNLALVVGVRGNIDESLSLLLEIDEKPTALSNLAYIHSRRGDYDLAEQRFREALAIDAKHKEATKGLADLSKLRPVVDVAIADSKPIERETFKPFDVEFSTDKPPVIQQVSAVSDDSKGSVMTANFEEEVAETTRPGLLDASVNFNAQPVSAKVSTAKFDEDDPSDPDAWPEKPVSVPREEPASDHDWDADVPSKVRSSSTTSTSSKPSREPFDFDEPSDQEIFPNRTAPVSSTNGDALKFVPTKSRSKTPATANESDEPW